jgi:hypothetical protein
MMLDSHTPTKVQQLLKWWGGKKYLAPRIIESTTSMIDAFIVGGRWSRAGGIRPSLVQVLAEFFLHIKE